MFLLCLALQILLSLFCLFVVCFIKCCGVVGEQSVVYLWPWIRSGWRLIHHDGLKTELWKVLTSVLLIQVIAVIRWRITSVFWDPSMCGVGIRFSTWNTADVCVCVCVCVSVVSGINPFMGKDNYSATSNNTTLVHWPLTGGLLHLVQREGDWVGPQPAQSSHRCAKCNSHPSTASVPIAVLLYCIMARCSAVLVCPWKG